MGRLVGAGQTSSPGETKGKRKEGACAAATFSRDGPGGSLGGARQCPHLTPLRRAFNRDQPTSGSPPLLSHLVAGYFAAAGIFAPVRTLVRAMTRDILRPYSECSPPYPLSFLVFSTGAEVREDSCITDHRCANHLINLWCSARILSSSLGLDGCRVQD